MFYRTPFLFKNCVKIVFSPWPSNNFGCRLDNSILPLTYIMENLPLRKSFKVKSGWNKHQYPYVTVDVEDH